MAPRMACNRVWKKTMVALGMGGRERWLSGLSGGGGNGNSPTSLTRFQHAKRDWTRCGPLLAKTTYAPALGQPLNAV